jgi:hypothetical protein
MQLASLLLYSTMGATQPVCPACGSNLGLPNNGSSLMCPKCGPDPSTPSPPCHQNAGIGNLSELQRQVPSGAPTGAQELLAELDEKIGDLASDIEALRSREQGAPLELGCALFGIFGLVILVLAFFATVGRVYFGGSLFYIVLTITILAGFYRFAPKLIARSELPGITRKRTEMEATLARLRTERERLKSLDS